MLLLTHTQWHVKFAFNFTSQGLIDPNAVYYAEILSGPRSGLAYKIKGRFPPAIYFSWQVRRERKRKKGPHVSRWLDFWYRLDRVVFRVSMLSAAGGCALTDGLT